MSTDFAFNIKPPPSVPFKFCVFTSQMDFFASNLLLTTFKWWHYHVEVLIKQCQSTVPSPGSPILESPILEYPSISAGGRVIETLTSGIYSPPSIHNLFTIFSRVSRENLKHSPAVALTNGMEPGGCWALHRDFRQIGIQFTHAIHLSSLVVGHASILSAASAPKKLVL